MLPSQSLPSRVPNRQRSVGVLALDATPVGSPPITGLLSASLGGIELAARATLPFQALNQYGAAMTGLEFVSSLVGDLIWPVLIFAVITMLRKPISKLLANGLESVDIGPAGLRATWFAKELQQAKEDLDPRPKYDNVTVRDGGGVQVGDGNRQTNLFGSDDGFLAEMQRLAAVSPRAVVLESHTRLEQALRDVLVADSAGASEIHRRRSIDDLAWMAEQRGIVNDGTRKAIESLTTLRNAVAHSASHSVTEQDALNYAHLAHAIALAIPVQFADKFNAERSSTQEPG